MKNEINGYITVKENFKPIPMIRSYSGDINQALFEIIKNAIDAVKADVTSESGVIDVSTYCDDESVYCKIEDNGNGIDNDNLSAVFNPFFTTKDVNVGKGLGLSIAHYIIVNKHNGSIDIVSEKGVGTKCVIKLPIQANELSKR
jgi:signal transduction histidine kinase